MIFKKTLNYFKNIIYQIMAGKINSFGHTPGMSEEDIGKAFDGADDLSDEQLQVLLNNYVTQAIMTRLKTNPAEIIAKILTPEQLENLGLNQEFAEKQNGKPFS